MAPLFPLPPLPDFIKRFLFRRSGFQQLLFATVTSGGPAAVTAALILGFVLDVLTAFLSTYTGISTTTINYFKIARPWVQSEVGILVLIEYYRFYRNGVARVQAAWDAEIEQGFVNAAKIKAILEEIAAAKAAAEGIAFQNAIFANSSQHANSGAPDAGQEGSSHEGSGVTEEVSN